MTLDDAGLEPADAASDPDGSQSGGGGGGGGGGGMGPNAKACGARDVLCQLEQGPT
jgi:hypothetical protein